MKIRGQRADISGPGLTVCEPFSVPLASPVLSLAPGMHCVPKEHLQLLLSPQPLLGATFAPAKYPFHSEGDAVAHYVLHWGDALTLPSKTLNSIFNANADNDIRQNKHFCQCQVIE